MRTSNPAPGANDGADSIGSAAVARRAQIFNEHNLDLYRDQVDQAADAVTAAVRRARVVHSGVRPTELAPDFEAVNLDEACGDMSSALAELRRLYLDHAVYFHHPRYAAHLNCPVLVPSIAAEVVLSAINSSLDTWDQSAGATFIEQKLIAWTAQRAGLGAAADGVFTSGGTQSNLMAMLLMRDAWCAREYGHGTVQKQGLPAEASKLRVFVSEISHFSLSKAAALLGLGHDAIVGVACDKAKRMDIAALSAAIADCRANGNIPIAVAATCGTTDFGSVDDMHAIGAVCRAEQLWMHVDAAYGCGLLVSNRHAHKLAGIENADSLTVDYHKSFFQPVSCSAFIVRRGADLGLITHHADYLNPREAAAAGTPDQVNKSLQTTKRFDALKLWLTLRTLGAEAIGEAFDGAVALARATYELMLAEPRLELLHRPALSTIVFRYRPCLTTPEDELDTLNTAIRSQLARDGEAMIAATRVDGRRYLKFTLLNPATTVEQMGEIVDLIVAYGVANHCSRQSIVAATAANRTYRHHG
ncbi:PLP-dependent enzyme, glutamate decarboxylase [Salinisphaera shabanensis T35B1]|uniref:pyridoxal phosphate-dependent decarboxylase family protein n=1 Tax=Salinisphaera shabanensis TaxID=180542 RepID=UPI00334015EB